MGVLVLAMRGLSTAGTAYAIWTGLGAQVSLLGVVLFDESLNLAQLCFIGLIIVGVAGTKYFAAA
jgi:quaternary ammonium compound-resistance protein SugE